MFAAGFAYAGYVYLTLPDVRSLAKDNPTTTAFMQLRIDEARDEGRAKFAIRHRWVPYSQISPNLRRAVIVTEDAGFYDHDGIDLNEVKAALEKNWEEGQFVRGASTITQQLAKNLYLSPSRNPMRKVRELLITRRLEAALTKRRILEIYLNMIEWCDGIFGCEAAARAYFGQPCASLSPDQAALLAGAIINPRQHSPAKPTRRLLRRQQIILKRMNIKEAPFDSAGSASGVGFAPGRPSNGTPPAPANATPPAPANVTPPSNGTPPVPPPVPHPFPDPGARRPEPV